MPVDEKVRHRLGMWQVEPVQWAVLVSLTWLKGTEVPATWAHETQECKATWRCRGKALAGGERCMERRTRTARRHHT